MRHFVLHDPNSQAHLEDLEDRLRHALAGVLPRPHDPTGTDTLIGTVIQVVQAMDAGVLSLEEVRAVLSSVHPPSSSFDRWLDERAEKGVYLEERLAQAA